MNLLRHLKREAGESDSIIRDILGTSRCDAFFDLKQVRDSTEKHLNKSESLGEGKPSRAERLQSNILLSDEDRHVVNYVLFKYRDWYIQELSKGLSWQSWCCYQMTVNPNDFYRTVSRSAVVGFCAGIMTQRAGFGAFGTAVASGASATTLTMLDRCRKYFNKRTPGGPQQ